MTKHLTLLLILVSLITINPRINGWNEASRMALTQSLVEQHSFVIDESTFSGTGDKVFIDGHFYSDKPAFPSIMASVVYAPLYAMGLRLNYGWNLSYYLIILFTVKAFWIASMIAFRKALAFTSAPTERHAILVLIYAFASLSFSWSATFNNHSLAGSSLMIALYYYLRAKNEPSHKALFVGGLFFGMAAAMDVPTAIFLLGFAVLVGIRWHMAREMLLFCTGAFVPLSVHFAVNYSIGGTLLPLQINQEFFVFEGSVWSDPGTLSGVHVNSPFFILKYGFLCLFGSKGFFWYNPLIVLLIPLWVQNLGRAGHFRSESWVITIGAFILMLYYFMFSTNYGGWSYSIRWFVTLLPLGFFYLFDINFQKYSGKRAILFWGLVVASIIIALVGLINPWSNQELHSIPIFANLIQLLGFLV